MHLVYYDEAGDDGYPNYSSELFVLTGVYMDIDNWKDNFNQFYEFRKELKNNYGLPIKTEFHTKHFITDKNPFRQFNWSPSDIKNILFDMISYISQLNIKIINLCINKTRIKNNDYNVLETALKYNIQRIENDFKKNYDEKEKFIIITDEGRVGKMRSVTRKIQRINYIPSMYNNNEGFNVPITRLIEDPLPKPSEEAYFIQIADTISYLVYLFCLKYYNQSEWANRVARKLTFADIIYLLNKLKAGNVLNTKASKKNDYGIVHYPN